MRLHDNLALVHALNHYERVYPVFILDDDNAGAWARGGASRVWLYHSLRDLSQSLGGTLRLYRGKADAIIPHLAKTMTKTMAKTANVQAVLWNRGYEPWRTQRDSRIKETLKNQNITAQSYNSTLLWEPWQIKKADGTPYKVFTPFFRKGCLGFGEPPAPVPAPPSSSLARLSAICDAPRDTRTPSGGSGDDGGEFAAITLDAMGLLPTKPRWDTPMTEHWTISEQGALARFDHFIEHGLKGYKTDRNRPDLDNVSMLSPYLHHGQISPRYVWHKIRDIQAAHSAPEQDTDHFLSELGWREFSAHLLYHCPTLPTAPLQEKFAAFPWAARDENASQTLLAWQKGQTGYPIVDAGMRQLWQTGWMHNRVRMIVGSFLVKHLLLHWRDGEDWFWDCLFDADLANNAASWQWIAGCGADAAPYFRIFNPITQGQKFDPAGVYVRHFVPEIAALPDAVLHSPWTASADTLRRAGITLGTTYPRPIIDHNHGRERALAAFKSLKSSGDSSDGNDDNNAPLFDALRGT